jgi:hypothetical protein
MMLFRLLIAAIMIAFDASTVFAQAAGGPVGAGDQFTWGNAATLGAVGMFGIGLWLNLDKRSRDERKVTQDNNDKIMNEFHKVYLPMTTRVEKLEDRGKEIMTKTEVKNDIEHLKINRQQAEQVINQKLDQAARDIIELGKAQARSETKHDGLAADVSSIKHTLETQDVKLDKMQDCLTAISVKIDQRP